MQITKVLASVLLFLTVAAQAQSMYRWKDEGGKWIYSDKPPAVGDVDKLGRGSKQPAKDQPVEAQKLYPLTLYSNACGAPCDAAKAFLGKHGVPFTSKDPSTPETYAELKEKSAQTVAPTLIVGDKALSGFEESAWEAALKAAGYTLAVKKAP